MWPWRLERIYEPLAPISVFSQQDSNERLSGMGPVSQNPNDCEKVFAGLYALYSGFVLVVVMGLILTPIFHRVLWHGLCLHPRQPLLTSSALVMPGLDPGIHDFGSS